MQNTKLQKKKLEWNDLVIICLRIENSNIIKHKQIKAIYTKTNPMPFDKIPPTIGLNIGRIGMYHVPIYLLLTQVYIQTSNNKSTHHVFSYSAPNFNIHRVE